MESVTINSEIIAWITVVLLVAAIPLTVFYFRYINKKNSDSLLQKIQASPTRPMLVDFDFNFDNNWSSDKSNFNYAVKPGSEKKLAKIVLKTIALNGEMGMLVKQISDILELHEIEVNYSLQYLLGKDFIESVTSQKGTIIYLTTRGSAYCNKKGYVTEVA